MTAGSSTVGNVGNGIPQFLLALQSFLAHLLHDFHSPVGSTPQAQAPPLRVGTRLLGSTPVFCPHANGSVPALVVSSSPRVLWNRPAKCGVIPARTWLSRTGGGHAPLVRRATWICRCLPWLKGRTGTERIPRTPLSCLFAGKRSTDNSFTFVNAHFFCYCLISTLFPGVSRLKSWFVPMTSHKDWVRLRHHDRHLTLSTAQMHTNVPFQCDIEPYRSTSDVNVFAHVIGGERGRLWTRNHCGSSHFGLSRGCMPRQGWSTNRVVANDPWSSTSRCAMVQSVWWFFLSRSVLEATNSKQAREQEAD